MLLLFVEGYRQRLQPLSRGAEDEELYEVVSDNITERQHLQILLEQR